MKLAVFDFNGTIFPKETIPFLLDCWKKYRYPKYNLYKLYLLLIPLILKYKYPFLSRKSKEEIKVEFMHKFVNIFHGMNKKEIDDYFLKVEKDAKQYYNKEIIEKIPDFKEENYELVLLSGAFYELLKIVGNSLQFDEVIGSSILKDRFNEIDKFSVLSGSLKLEVLKIKYASEDVNWDSSYAFADSIDDLSLLESIGNPVVVDPDQKLLNIAKKRNWEIIKTKRG